MFYNARYYSSVLGRFISADTMVPGAGDPQQFNRYAYVSNNPIKNTDPTGHKECYGYAPSNQYDMGNGVGDNSCAGGDWDAVRAEENLGKMQDQVRAECAAAHGACDTKPQDMLVLAGIGLVGMVAPELIGGGMDIAGGLGVRATVACVNSAICATVFGLGGASGVEAAGNRGSAAQGISEDGEFYSVTNGAGGKVWVSNGEIVQADFEGIVQNAGNDPVTILSGAHGDAEGGLTRASQFFKSDQQVFGNNLNVSVLDVKAMSRDAIQNIVGTNPNTVICAWCYSDRSYIIKQILGNR